MAETSTQPIPVLPGTTDSLTSTNLLLHECSSIHKQRTRKMLWAIKHHCQEMVGHQTSLSGNGGPSNITVRKWWAIKVRKWWAIKHHCQEMVGHQTSLSGNGGPSNITVRIWWAIKHHCQEIGLVWFGLCCLMTPGLSKDIWCHV